MKQFLKRHAHHITGTLTGFDRVLFRGTLRSISYQSGMEIFLSSQHVLYKDFGGFAQKISDRLKTHAEAMAQQLQRPLIYVASAKESKQAIAQAIMEKEGITEGLICIISCVEPCQSYSIRRDQATHHVLLTVQQRKCLHLYFYYRDREFGLMHLRLQTWLPMSIQICINGREWLARALDKAHIGYERHDNCFTRIDDLPRAQQLLDQLSQRKWHRLFTTMARRVNPWLNGNGALDLHGYYWTVREAEFATDIVFRDAESLKEYYPQFVRHAIDQFHSEDVLRFLGRRTNIRFNGEVRSDLTRRTEGVRVKHWVESNSIKMYDKQGRVLRIETTINNPRQFKVRRHVKRQGNPVTAWVKMRKGVVDMRRLVQVCRTANERYLEALAVIGESSPSHTLLDSVSVPVTRNGRRYRALRPISPEDASIFQRVFGPAALLQGFRNKDIRPLPDQQSQSPTERRKATAHTSRTLRLLCAHDVIYRVPTTNYYRITQRGQQIITTSLRFRQSNIALLAA